MWPTTAVPSQLTALKSQLNACASWVTAGGATGQIHYPQINPSGVVGSADTLPAALLERGQLRRIKYAEGAKGVPAGSLAITLYLSSSTYTSASACEALADAIAEELTATDAGLPITEVEVEEASDPSPAAKAAKETSPAKVTDFRTVRMVVQYGLRPR